MSPSQDTLAVGTQEGSLYSPAPFWDLQVDGSPPAHMDTRVLFLFSEKLPSKVKEPPRTAPIFIDLLCCLKI